MKPSEKLRELMNNPGILVAPGAYDAWSAKLIELSGFPLVYMTGFGVSASLLAQPDVGLITMSEMVFQAKNIANAVKIPVIADGDTGYGGILNVIRTVQEYEKIGVAAIQIEDQVFPKRCGHMEGKEVIPLKDMIAKIKAADWARNNILIVARTDARSTHGFEEAIKRAKAYEKAGADILFVEALESEEEMIEAVKQLEKPLLANMVEGGKTPFLSSSRLNEIGFKIVIYPVSSLFAATKAIQEALEMLKMEELSTRYSEKKVSFKEFNQLIGLNEIRDLEAKMNVLS